jgi:hypothetical protein
MYEYAPRRTQVLIFIVTTNTLQELFNACSGCIVLVTMFFLIPLQRSAIWRHRPFDSDIGIRRDPPPSSGPIVLTDVSNSACGYYSTTFAPWQRGKESYWDLTVQGKRDYVPRRYEK